MCLPQEESTASQALQSAMPFVLSRPSSPSHPKLPQHGSKAGRVECCKKQSPYKAKKNLPLLLRPIRSPKESSPPPPPQVDKRKLDPLTILKMQIHTELIKEMDLKKDLTQAKDEASKQELRQKTQIVVARLTD